jgi:hypothetical protein
MFVEIRLQCSKIPDLESILLLIKEDNIEGCLIVVKVGRLQKGVVKKVRRLQKSVVKKVRRLQKDAVNKVRRLQKSVVKIVEVVVEYILFV